MEGLLNERPIAECYCAACHNFDMTGYEEENKYSEDGYKSGYCSILKRITQAWGFCSYGFRKDCSMTIDDVVNKILKVDEVDNVKADYQKEVYYDLKITSDRYDLSIYEEIAGIIIECEDRMKTPINFMVITKEEY